MIRKALYWYREGKSLGVTQAVYANTFWSRFMGLLAQPVLVENEGLVIKPCSSIHTFFMRYSIDVVFIGRDHKVLKVASRIAPWRGAYCFGASYVVELAAGAASRLALIQGDVCQCQLIS